MKSVQMEKQKAGIAVPFLPRRSALCLDKVKRPVKAMAAMQKIFWEYDREQRQRAAWEDLQFIWPGEVDDWVDTFGL